MSNFRSKIRAFFYPPPESPLWVRLLPYVSMGILTLVFLIGAAYGWEYTNSPEFCGTVCHTMPPEYTAYLVSPHARVDCVDCHIGKGFIATRITRKAGDLKHIVSLIFQDYEYPIRAKQLRPARDTCEHCHFPEKFSDDSLRAINTFSSDLNNSPLTIYLTLKTGGGSSREGLGRGIHWHIENQVLYLAQDREEQDIPFVRVIESDGTVVDYVELGSGINPDSVLAEDLKVMDCIACHNRISHLILQPDETVDELLRRGVISREIPEIKRLATEVLGLKYETQPQALAGIAGLAKIYREAYPDFTLANPDLIDEAVIALQEAYTQSVFPEQKVDWNSHPNNTGHSSSPGCFRCHDGEHLNANNEAIRLECNLCHSIPVVAGPSDFVARIEISRGPEPNSHLNTNWITMHRQVFDVSCENCHTVSDPGGTSNQSFCSNSACHGIAYRYAGFDAPGLAEILAAQRPTPVPAAPITVGGELTFNALIGPVLKARCASCHGASGIQGLNVLSYSALLSGSASGAVVIPGDAENSLLVSRLSGKQAHFSQLTQAEMESLIAWINAGAPE